MKTICALLAICLLPVAEAAAATEQEVVNQSASILRQFRRMPERGIPRSVLRNAKGLAIMTVVKVGFGLSGKGGQGVVVARTGSGWSGPSFIGTGGAGWGPQIGAQISEFVFVLNTNRAVRAFSRDGNVTVGGEVSAAAGPVGRDLAGGRDANGRNLHLQPQQRPFRGRIAGRCGHRDSENGESSLLRTSGELTAIFSAAAWRRRRAPAFFAPLWGVDRSDTRCVIRDAG